MNYACKFGLCACLASALISCQDNRQLPPALEISSSKLELPSDAAATADPTVTFPVVLTDSLIVSATCSWAASVKADDGGEWISLKTAEHINLSGKRESTALVFTLERNRTSSPRTAKAMLYGAGLSEPVGMEIVQAAYTPYLDVQLAGQSAELPSSGAVAELVIRANTSWTSSVDPSSTVVPQLYRTAGQTPSLVSLFFPDNMDETLSKKAVVNISAEGCDTRQVTFTQQKGEFFFCLESEVAAEQPPYLDTVHIPLKSNGPWTAEILRSSFANASISPSYGNYTQDGFYFTADHGADPEVALKEAVIAIHREGMEDIMVSFAQKGCIHLRTVEINPEYEWLNPVEQYSPYRSAGYPFSSPSSLPSSYNNGTHADKVVDCVMKNGGYVFTVYGQDCGVWCTNSNTALCVGKMKDDYVLLPAIAGYRLSGMYYQASCRVATPYTVRTEDNSRIIAGGEYRVTRKVVPVDTEYHDVQCHTFPSTLPDTRYRINLEKNLDQISIKDLCLTYEKAE